jgi:predicted MPP superfamily phosphohydrolase
MIVLSAILLFWAVLGHWSFCLWLSNTINGLGWSRLRTKLCSKPVDWFLSLGTLALAFWLWQNGAAASGPDAWQAFPLWLKGYAVFAMGVATLFFPPWLWRQLTVKSPAVLQSNHTAVFDLKRELPGQLRPRGLGHVYLRLPGNQSYRLSIHEKTLEMPRLPATLDGMSIAHLSDLHFTGRISKAYFDEVVRRTNELDCDLIALTGDLVDCDACLQWVPDTLGKLRARHGVYFILGNHDLRTDHVRLRAMLTDAGAVDLSGRWLTQQIRGQRVVLAGNELPWIGPAADMQSCDADEYAGCFRIALAHTPDQVVWARRHDFDLMLAGHTHGGQIRFPLIGPILAPSLYGVRYASGTFHVPPTVMHVSRGISGLQPIRWNCPPELAKLVLKSPCSR